MRTNGRNRLFTPETGLIGQSDTTAMSPAYLGVRFHAIGDRASMTGVGAAQLICQARLPMCAIG